MPTIIAHRGFAGVAPENTVAAARAAIDAGADGIEIDVQPAVEGTPVVFHDAHLGPGDRGITDASGVVWETPLESLLAAEVLGSGETVPRLTDVLDAVSPSVLVNVELKNPGSFAVGEGDREERIARWRPFVERTLEDLAGYGHDVLLSSFHEGALAAVRDLTTERALAPIVGDDLDAGIELADRYDCAALHPSWDALADGRRVDAGAVERLRAADATVNVWTTTTWWQADRLLAAGVDGLIADYPGLDRFVGRDATE